MFCGFCVADDGMCECRTDQLLCGKESSGSVYFIKALEIDRYKIGFSFSGSPLARADNLACSSPVRLAVVGWVRTWKQTERFLHKHFAASKVHREWFCETESLRKLAEISDANVFWPRKWYMKRCFKDATDSFFSLYRFANSKTPVDGLSECLSKHRDRVINAAADFSCDSAIRDDFSRDDFIDHSVRFFSQFVPNCACCYLPSKKDFKDSRYLFDIGYWQSARSRVSV